MVQAFLLNEYMYYVVFGVGESASHHILLDWPGLCAFLKLNATGVLFYFGNITNSVLLRHDRYNYYWDIHVHGYPFWTKLFWFSKCSHLGMFQPLKLRLEYTIKYVTIGPPYVKLYFQLGYSTVELWVSELIVLVVLVMWINHLPLVCWSTFGKLVLKYVYL